MPKKPEAAAFVIEGVRYEVPEKLTLGDLADMEEAVGGELDLEKGGARALVGMLYVAMRRKRPEITVDDVRALDMELVTSEEAAPRPPGRNAKTPA